MKPSDYLVQAYRGSGHSLYSHTLFHRIAHELKALNEPPRVLDLGCADGRSRRLLENHGARIGEYFGVDHHADFKPSLRADVRDVEAYMDRLPFAPNVVLLTDVLEHLDGGADDIGLLLSRLVKRLPRGCRIFISVPQMYRLDRWKLAHLHYPEHKVRFDLPEWRALVSRETRVRAAWGVGYLSVLPYLIMFWPWYDEGGVSGKIFLRGRDLLSRWGILRAGDVALTKWIGSRARLMACANSVLFMVTPPCGAGG